MRGYIETARDGDWVTIYDQVEGKTITLPLKGGQAFVAEDVAKKKWKPLFIIKKTSKDKIVDKKSIGEKEKSEGKEERVLKGIDYKTTCVSRSEADLLKYLLNYRGEKKLGALKVSKSLTHIAKLHAKDLSDHKRPIGCLLQSWSEHGNWVPCCYTSDHRNSECMLKKPFELTDYKSEGYEIVYQSTDSDSIDSKKVFAYWKESLGNSAVLTEGRSWEKKTWKSIGVGIYGAYAVVWLGREDDPEPIPGMCQ
jgi:hypothetical protein